MYGSHCHLEDHLGAVARMELSSYTTIVDFEKAFDSVNRDVLWKLLLHYGIPEKYITLLQKTYDNCSCRVIHNGVLSELIEMLTGVCQGCLALPFLFLAGH